MWEVMHAKVAIMTEEVEEIESGGKTDFQYGKESSFWYDPVKIDKELHDSDIIKLGDITMTALHTAGHSKGGTTWVMNVVDSGKLYNVVFPDGSGINPGYHVTDPESYPGMGNDYRRTLQTLEMLKPDIWLSSHSAVMNFEAKRKLALTEGVKAWVDPEGYMQFVVGERVKFEAEINRELGNPPKKAN
jgi:metallo-beta-lactamase class B